VIHSLLAVVGLGLLAMVLWRDRPAICELLSRPLNWPVLILSLVMTQVNLFIAFGRWAILVRALDRRISVRTSMLLGFIGYAFNLVIPGGVGGDVVKAAYLARMQIKRTQAIASMLMDRCLGLLGLLILAAGAGALVWNPATTEVRRLAVAAWAMLGCSMAFVLALLAHKPFGSFAVPLARSHSRLSMVATELNAMSRTYRKRPGVLVTGLLLSLLSHGLTVTVFYLLGKAFFGSRMATSLEQHFLMVPLILLTMAVPLPFGALGLSEDVGSHLFGMVRHPSGAIALLGLRLLMVACALESACLYLLRLQEVRELTEETRNLPNRFITEPDGIEGNVPSKPANVGLPAPGGP
jgi:uncharacterized protein (TIRG00374 family)